MSVCLPLPHLVPLSLRLCLCLSPLCLGLFPSLSPWHSPRPGPRPSLSLFPLVAPVVWTSSAPFCPDDLTSPPHTCAHTHCLSHSILTHTGLWLGFILNLRGPTPSPGLPGQVPGRGKPRPAVGTLCLVSAQPSSPLPITAPPSPPGSGSPFPFRQPSPLSHPPFGLMLRLRPWPGSWGPGSSWLSHQHPG